ncbi:hypothetical protein NQ317_012858, partial [Molorchus minor]
SEAVWTVHVNAKQHKQNIQLAKKLKERTNNFTSPLKRALTPPIAVPEKKTKGILKNSQTTENLEDPTKSTDFQEDFLNKTNGHQIKILQQLGPNGKTEIMESEGKDLPEGFFDDPKLDAKARNQEYKDPIEEEWDKFLRAIKEANNESNAIIAEDQEEATTERQIDEIDEQITKLSKVLDLEKKKVEVISVSSEFRGVGFDDDNDLEEQNFDEFLDWRKKSF